MATTTARRRSTHPMSYYRNMVVDMLMMKDIKAIYDDAAV